MKSRLILSVLMAVSIIGVYGQRPTITLTFAADKIGQHVPLNSILIENLTREVDTTLYAPDTVLVIDYLVGINENHSIGGDGFYLSQNYPNPFGGETSIDLLLPETENVLIVFSDILGRELVNRNFRLERGKHCFTFYPGTESLYFLTARTDRYSQTIKMINTPAQSLSPANSSLEYKGMKSGFEQYKSGNDETSFVYYLGDLLKFTAFTEIGERVISSSPTGNQSYNFIFTGQSCPDTPTVTDIEGNIYNTVLIGGQCWMKENLKTTHYRNGTAIEYPGDNNLAWQTNTSGAYAWYNNNINWKDSYGALYNYHAVNSVHGLCPEGWYVPSDNEWTQLVDFVIARGFPNSNLPNGAGNAVKSCRQVNSPQGGCNTTEHPRWVQNPASGFDQYGFSGLPAGGRYFNGEYSALGSHVAWFSSTENYLQEVWGYSLFYSQGYITRSAGLKSTGISVRCLRNDLVYKTYQLNLEKEPSGAGTVSGAGTFKVGDLVKVSANAYPGWQFINWTDEDGIVSEIPVFNYLMPAKDITLTANFVDDPGSFSCGDSFIDDRDGQTYASVSIGSQCWMAQNLNIGTRINGNIPQTNNNIIEKYCYNNSNSNCNLYGGLYRWNEMMQYSVIPGVQGICPDGWHIPNNNEWNILVNYLSSTPEYQCNGNTDWISKSLAATSYWTNSSITCAVGNNLSANNSAGFTALPAGSCTTGGSFGNIGNYGYWWSSSQLDPSSTWIRFVYYNTAEPGLDYFFEKTGGISVRCLRN